MSDKNLDKELEKNENEINESQDKDADKKVTEQQSSDNNSQSEDNKEDEYEKICYVCRRPESKAGKMIDMPGGICVCADCLQKSFDSFQNMGMGMNAAGGMMQGVQQQPTQSSYQPPFAQTQTPVQQAEPTQTQSMQSDPYEEIKKAKELLDAGIISQEDFDAKKKSLLGI